MPTIKPGMRLSFSLESLIALIGGAVFCTAFYYKVDRLEHDMALVKSALGLTNVPAPSDSTSTRGILRGKNP